MFLKYVSKHCILSDPFVGQPLFPCSHSRGFLIFTLPFDLLRTFVALISHVKEASCKNPTKTSEQTCTQAQWSENPSIHPSAWLRLGGNWCGMSRVVLTSISPVKIAPCWWHWVYHRVYFNVEFDAWTTSPISISKEWWFSKAATPRKNITSSTCVCVFIMSQ